MNIPGVATFLLFISCSFGTLLDLTVEVPAGKEECFWQYLPADTSSEIDYQVIDGGDLDVRFAISGPDNMIYYQDWRKTENFVEFKSTVEGDYKFCFDNTFSTISKKVVFFEISVKDGNDDNDDEGDENITFEEENLQDQLDMTVQDFLGILERSKQNLERSIQIQTLIRVHEAKDRNLQEGNFFRVNFFSCFQLVLMISVGLIQVVMIRNLFMDKHSVSSSSLKSRT